jgi:hypothetical protein
MAGGEIVGRTETAKADHRKPRSGGGMLLLMAFKRNRQGHFWGLISSPPKILIIEASGLKQKERKNFLKKKFEAYAALNECRKRSQVILYERHERGKMFGAEGECPGLGVFPSGKKHRLLTATSRT